MDAYYQKNIGRKKLRNNWVYLYSLVLPKENCLIKQSNTFIQNFAHFSHYTAVQNKLVPYHTSGETYLLVQQATKDTKEIHKQRFTITHHARSRRGSPHPPLQGKTSLDPRMHMVMLFLGSTPIANSTGFDQTKF